MWDLRSSGSQSTLWERLLVAAKESTAGTNINLSTTLRGTVRPVSEEIAENFVRIPKESIQNAVKHGSPTLIEIDLVFDRHAVDLMVKDNGCGFNVINTVNQKSNHFGIIGIRERGRQLEGEVIIEIEPGEGCTIRVMAPRPAGKGVWVYKAHMVRIMCVDNHPLARKGIASILAGESDIVLVCEAADGRSAVTYYREYSPDVTLMDLRCPE